MDKYDPEYVEQLFDRMSGSYDLVNFVSSFGFSHRWRQQFVQLLGLAPGMVVCDLMCGGGDCWPGVLRQVGPGGSIVGIDFSGEMLRHAGVRRANLGTQCIELRKENALSNSLEDASVDALLCGFGLKTLRGEQRADLAREIKRVLKPGGRFSLIEVSDPRGWPLRGLYLFYLKRLIPIIGRALLGDFESYRMLGVYTEEFGNCAGFVEDLQSAGLETEYRKFFCGCATGVSGRKGEE